MGVVVKPLTAVGLNQMGCVLMDIRPGFYIWGISNLEDSTYEFLVDSAYSVGQGSAITTPVPLFAYAQPHLREVISSVLL